MTAARTLLMAFIWCSLLLDSTRAHAGIMELFILLPDDTWQSAGEIVFEDGVDHPDIWIMRESDELGGVYDIDGDIDVNPDWDLSETGFVAGLGPGRPNGYYRLLRYSAVTGAVTAVELALEFSNLADGVESGAIQLSKDDALCFSSVGEYLDCAGSYWGQKIDGVADFYGKTYGAIGDFLGL